MDFIVSLIQRACVGLEQAANRSLENPIESQTLSMGMGLVATLLSGPKVCTTESITHQHGKKYYYLLPHYVHNVHPNLTFLYLYDLVPSGAAVVLKSEESASCYVYSPCYIFQREHLFLCGVSLQYCIPFLVLSFVHLIYIEQLKREHSLKKETDYSQSNSKITCRTSLRVQ